MLNNFRAYHWLAVFLLAAADSGCASSDERLRDIPLAAHQYDPMEHFPPAPDADGLVLSELKEIRGLLRDGKFAAAIEEMDRCISEGRGSASASRALPQLLVLRGMTRFKLHNAKEALSDYDAAIALDSSYWPAYFHRWQCHLELGNRSAANDDRDAGRQLAPQQFERDYDPHPAGMI